MLQVLGCKVIFTFCFIQGFHKIDREKNAGFLLVYFCFTESDSIVKTPLVLPALITWRLVINCQMSSCCTVIPLRNSKTRYGRMGRISGHPQQPGALVSPRVYRLRSDSFQLYSHSDLPIRAPLPEVYQREAYTRAIYPAAASSY